jgi:hypothetical protein
MHIKFDQNLPIGTKVITGGTERHAGDLISLLSISGK